MPKLSLLAVLVSFSAHAGEMAAGGEEQYGKYEVNPDGAMYAAPRTPSPKARPANAPKPWKTSGVASYYHEPQALGCGGKFNPEAFTAAHLTLPCGTKVKVTNRRTKKSVVVLINDYGPYNDRIIDLSRKSFRTLGNLDAGTMKVDIQVVPKDTNVGEVLTEVATSE